MKIYTEDDFINLIRGDIKPLTKQEFMETPHIGKLWDKMKEDDIRRISLKTKEKFYEYYYNFLISDEPLKEFFNARLSFINVKSVPSIIIENKILKNKSNNARFLRNINLPSILDTLSSEGNSFINFYKEALEHGKNITPITMPSAFKDSINGDYSAFVVSMKTKSGIASIFSPIIYKALLEYSGIKGKILMPTASWGSPVLAVKDNSIFTDVHILDVQKNVLNVCEELNNQLSNDFFESYNFKTFCKPSEKMSEVVDKDYDGIFFCPPYYDLEGYGGSEEQSTELYNTYEKWLDGYWRGTVNESYKVLKPKGKFCFTIGRYVTGRYMATDLLEIAKEKFELIDEVKIMPPVESKRSSNKTERYEICYFMEKKDD